MTKLMAGRPQMEQHTIKATLKIVPQVASTRSRRQPLAPAIAIALALAVDERLLAQAKQTAAPQCYEPAIAGFVALGAIAIFATLLHLTRKLIKSYYNFLQQERE